MYSVKGNLKKINDVWTINGLPIHEDHSLWVKVFGKEDMELNYFPDNDVARLTSKEGYIQTIYPQD